MLDSDSLFLSIRGRYRLHSSGLGIALGKPVSGRKLVGVSGHVPCLVVVSTYSAYLERNGQILNSTQ